MRGRRDSQATMLAFVDLEERVSKNHPLRIIKAVADEALDRLSPEFDRMYSKIGRASVPPERLLKASLLISLYSVPSERSFCEELEYNLLFRWFLDTNLMECSFDPTVFTKNRQRLLEHEISHRRCSMKWCGKLNRQGHLVERALQCARGTLVEAEASIKSFRRRQQERQPPDDDSGNPYVDFRGEALRNEKHESSRDPEARLVRKGKGREAKLVFLGHALMENRNGLLIDFVVNGATGAAERDAVPTLLDDARERGFRPQTLGGDKGYDTRECVSVMRDRGVTPHVAQRVHSAIDGRTTRHSGYRESQKVRKQVEEVFGWMKTEGGFRRTRYRGVELTGLAGYFVATAYNLVRMVNLMSSQPTRAVQSVRLAEGGVRPKGPDGAVEPREPLSESSG